MATILTGLIQMLIPRAIPALIATHAAVAVAIIVEGGCGAAGDSNLGVGSAAAWCACCGYACGVFAPAVVRPITGCGKAQRMSATPGITAVRLIKLVGDVMT